MMRFDYFARQSRRHGPVFKSNYFVTPMVCITDLELATRLFRDAAEDLGHRPLTYDRHVPEGAIRWAPEPRHTDLRLLFGRAMPPSLVSEWRPLFAQTATGQLATAGGTDVDPRGLLREAARQCCSAVLLGIAATDPAYSDVRTRMGRLDICRAEPVSDEETRDHLEVISALVRHRLHNGGSLGPHSVAVRLDADRPGVLDDDGVMRNLIYLALGPRDDVAGLMTWVCWYVAHNPVWLEQVRSASADARVAIAGRIVSETLRLDQSEYVMRTALREIRVEDHVIPAGWLVRVCTREIHRDPRNFDEPARFDPERFAAGSPRHYAPLGIDHHSCIGAPLARAIVEEFVIALAIAFDLRVVADGEREFSVNGHWAPSPEFRVVLSPRVSAT
jgi:cytochrome P450